ncbi:uncharacterized protein LOC110692614 [Chenopodium quinoa]|uniref:uncharacterized protein LOC110692614 n=1 Tax=Chenopodium quinoa TaxID=63459 RepID=UPI000B77731B|nr:uncharacterized protein LOC110692614 [Chenopodium quinoa]
MTARLRKIMPLLISEAQSAFLPGRLMSNNSLIVHELLTYMNSSTSRLCSAALKLDMNKAYDRVNWEFLWDVLKAFGFPPYWIQLIKQYVSTVSYQILINGKPSSVLRSACGLRQGDPLSPYLFVLCMEVFSIMLRKAETAGLFQGLRISRRAPSVSHLFFADDALLLFRVTPDACLQLLGVIDRFCTVFGQMVNAQRSFVKFSSNTPEDYRDFLSSALKMQAKSSLGTYLGLPVDLGRAKCHQFQPLVDKVMLPGTIADRINHLLARFWWKSNKSSRGLALTSSASNHLPRGLGGLGIRHVPSFNSALLAKKMWRLIHHPQLLVSRIYRARYPHVIGYKATTSPSRPSWGCRSFLEGARTLSQGIMWKVGSGKRVRILEDNWVPGVSVRFKDSAPLVGLPSLVTQLIDPISHAWDISHIFQQCDFTCLVQATHHLEAIRSLPMDRDFCTWSTATISELAKAKNWNGLDDLISFWWAVWLTRNNLRFRSEVFSPAGVFAIAANWSSRSKEARELSDLCQASCPQGFGGLGCSSHHALGLLQPSSQYDISLAFDGAWTDVDQRAGMGWFLSSNLSSPSVRGGAQAGFASSALHAELLACLLGLHHVKDKGFTSVGVFTVCSSVPTLIDRYTTDSISVL